MNPTLRRHDFSPDSTAVDRPGGKPACVLCGLPEVNRVHADPPVDESARIVGERAETLAAQQQSGPEQVYDGGVRRERANAQTAGLDPDMHDRSPA